MDSNRDRAVNGEITTENAGDKGTAIRSLAERRPILRKRVFLYLTEFFAGMSVMAVELGASRLLAPYFSSSQIVWTIIIGTIMIAMALGNLYGGRSADKRPDPDRLYLRILVAAVWIAAIPFLGRYVIIGISGLLVVAVNSGFLIWAGFLACMVVFVFPLFLLGTVTPSLVKYTMESLDDSGAVVGKLNAFNTSEGVTVPSRKSGKTKITMQARKPAQIRKPLLTATTKRPEMPMMT